MPLKPEVLSRLLLSKSFLEKIRFQPVASHDSHTLASNIITAHDALELTLAAICDQLGCLPPKSTTFLMDYFEPLKKAMHPDSEVSAKEYCRNLNTVRNGIKHQGLFPDAKQWSRVGESSYQHITKWCWDYLAESFSELDYSALLIDAEVKALYIEAKGLAATGDFKGALEKLAFALSKVFADNSALRGFEAGNSSAESAIRLSGFGVHANDYLALQQFLPTIRTWGSQANTPIWKQSQFGHAGNWRQQTVEFCLRTFVDVAVKIQGAAWIPGALERNLLYDQQVEALKEGVEIWEDVRLDSFGKPLEGLAALSPFATKTQRQVLKTLKQGEKVRAFIRLASEMSPNPITQALGPSKSKDTLQVTVFDADGLSLYGKVLASEVRVTCVPKAEDYINQYFPGLPEFEWDPE